MGARVFRGEQLPSKRKLKPKRTVKVRRKKKPKDEFLDMEVELEEEVSVRGARFIGAEASPGEYEEVEEGGEEEAAASESEPPTPPVVEIPGVTVSTKRCPECGGFINLRVSNTCYHCGFIYGLQPEKDFGLEW